MKHVEFVSLQEIVRLHLHVIKRFDGASGIRDIGLLESAIGQPQMILFEKYIHNDIYEMSAAYFFHIIKNHPFIDGNKRTGLLTALIFLRKNGFCVKADMDELYLLAVHTAASKITKDEIAEFFRKVIKRIKRSPKNKMQ